MTHVVTYGLVVLGFVVFFVFVSYGVIRERMKTPRHREIERQLAMLGAQAHRVRPNQINHTNSGGHGNYKWTAKEQREWHRIGRLQAPLVKELLEEERQLSQRIEQEWRSRWAPKIWLVRRGKNARDRE